MSADHVSTIRTETVKGAGLARGPALIVGGILAVFGLILFFEVSGAPLSTSGFPDAQAQGERFLGFEANAWTAWLTIAAGVLLLFGAAQHLAAKTMSLIVGLALGAGSVIALVDGNDVLGLAAANGLTALGWGIAAGVLLANTLVPRVRHERTVEPAQPDAETRSRAREDVQSQDHDQAEDRDIRAVSTSERYEESSPRGTEAQASDPTSDAIGPQATTGAAAPESPTRPLRK